MKGKVVKAVTSRFVVEADGKTYTCFGRKKLKSGGDIFVGDEVVFTTDKQGSVIEEVLPRRNALVRPYVANIDVCLIVVAPVPEPDFLLVDKVIVNCFMNGIEPVVVANKSDISKLDLSDYENVAQTRHISAENHEGLSDLLCGYEGKVVCFAGQSAVGKSSIINSLFEEDMCETGELSVRINRGKNTTRQSVIVKYNNVYVVDTCGFSMLELPENMNHNDLAKYYEDFLPYVSGCKFRNACTHTTEPDCAVKAKLGEGVSKGRYDRYLVLYNELHERWKKKYE